MATAHFYYCQDGADPRGGAVLPSPPQAVSLLVKSSPSAHFISLLRSRTELCAAPALHLHVAGCCPDPATRPAAILTQSATWC